MDAVGGLFGRTGGGQPRRAGARTGRLRRRSSFHRGRHRRNLRIEGTGLPLTKEARALYKTSLSRPAIAGRVARRDSSAGRASGSYPLGRGFDPLSRYSAGKRRQWACRFFVVSPCGAHKNPEKPPRARGSRSLPTRQHSSLHEHRTKAAHGCALGRCDDCHSIAGLALWNVK